MTRTPCSDERGIAMITTLLVLMMMAALLIGFTTIVMSDQRYRFIDHDRGQAFYAASGAVEKMTVDLGNLFLQNVAPTNAQVTALTATSAQPVITGITYSAASAPQALASSELSTYHCRSTTTPTVVNRQIVTVGSSGYTVSFCANTLTNNPTTTADPTLIVSGTYAGLYGLKTPYQIDVTARTATGGEVHLIRSIEAVAIPVFQFGIFSDVDLAFNAADDFSFGGRVHTNGNLFLSEAAGNTLTLSDKVTAFKEVVRQQLSNGGTIDSNSDTGVVSMAKGGGAFVTMDRTWGSVVDGPTSAANEPTWTSKSLGTYAGWIKNGRTGAKRLNLPLIAVGGTNTDLVQRPATGEDPTSIKFTERLFAKASIRVLLSDTPTDLTNLPTIDTATEPKSLESGSYGTAAYGVSTAIPVAASPGMMSVALTANTSSGTNKTLTMAAVPAFFAATMPLTATSGTNTWALTGCTGKTGTKFLSCTVATTHGTVNTIPVAATIANAGGVSTTSTACSGGGCSGSQSASGNGVRDIFVSNTMGFGANTFWIDDDVITCSGYTATTLTGCALPNSVSNGDKITNFSMSPAGTSLLGGWIKIERQNIDGTWHDITQEILDYGIGAPSQSGSCTGTDPSPNAILRMQRLADDGWTSPCLVAPSIRPTAATDYWPNTLWDQREAWQRESGSLPTGQKVKLGGVMHYVAIDAANLAKWFAGAAPYNVMGHDTGEQSKPDNGGYSIYFSDRRNNRDAASKETGEWGYEDFVNPASSTGTPNGTLDTGEDLNGNGTLETYGATPNCAGVYSSLGPVTVNGVTISCADTSLAPFAFNTALQPLSDLVAATEGFTGVGRAMTNRAIMFRRAIKLINGSTLATWVTGLTVVTENPAYVQGNWNVSTGACTSSGITTESHAATSLIADAVTVLSSNWSDTQSYSSLYSASGGRSQRTPNSCYRMAVLSGKGMIFPKPSGTGATFGTDGGVHSFLRFLEASASTIDKVHYKGSMATFYYSRQAVGIFKGQGGYVYGIPVRDYTFDTDFLTPSLLPPLTPMFRDMNAVGFSQELRPGK